MATNKRVNENYIHHCGSVQIEIASHIVSLSDMGYDASQTVKIIDFYLFHAPILKNDKSSNAFGLKSLKEFGWIGPQALSKLEGQLLKASNISFFCFIKSDTIDGTLESMNLGDRICVEHPRAVLKQNAKAFIHEDGGTELRQQETRMECLFRHIRNSLAHNHTYLFNNGNIMLEDTDDNGKISARILMPKLALLTWIDIVFQAYSDETIE